MNPLVHDDFLLQSPVARQLYHDVAARLPVIDYHCHVDAKALAEDRQFNDLTELWIAADPYKHRAMRILGIPESDITGPATSRVKFDRWASAVPKTIGNPLYHWTALELKRYFDIDEPLTPASADRIWENANEQLRALTYSSRGLLARMNVSHLCTSDLLSDDLSHHTAIAKSSFATKVWPSLRVDGLGASDESDDMLLARLDAFDRAGCRLADHSLDTIDYDPSSRAAERFRWLGREYVRRGWTLLLHIGAQRRTSSRLRKLVGPAGGYATAGRPCDVAALVRLLDDLEQASALPRVILFPLNPADYVPLAILTGSFAEDSVVGKIQLGPAWWFNDHALGITQHLNTLSSYGLLGTFVGMTTDSRSLLSMVRHEYFRRVFCNWLAEQINGGLFPSDDELIAPLVRGVCFENAKRLLTTEDKDVG